MAYVEYRHNNSGGSDWLKEADWQKLLDAGWTVQDVYSGRIYSVIRRGLSLHDAIVEWQSLTGLDPAAEGCNCCGVPHSFMLFADNGPPVQEMQIVRPPNTWKVEDIKW